ncbi:hypothetical protein Tco_0055583 [Tanacetum coccineum]
MSSPPSVSHHLLVITTTSSPQQRPTGAFGSVVKDAFGLTNDHQGAFGCLKPYRPGCSWFEAAIGCVWVSGFTRKGALGLG